MSTLADMKKIYNQLKSENKPEDSELIAYYDKMLPIWITKAYDKAISNIGRFSVRKAR